MPAYSLTEVTVLDEAGAQHYAELTRAAVAAYGGAFRVLAAEADIAEGEWAPDKRVVLIEFPDMQHIHRWYHSAEYAPAREIARTALERTLVFVEGVEDGGGEGALELNDAEATVRRFYEAMSSGDTSAARDFLSEGWEDIPLPPGVPAGVEGFTATVAFLRAAFPDLSVTVEDVLISGDRVATRVVARGTHLGEFLGVAPTGRIVEFRAFDFHRLSSGKIAQSWHIEDLFAVLDQLQG
ncbi:ester cyclase [Microbacterium sp. CCNWLW134]|uniref:ester cyclase n=1 Tax=Microbacterium sp. CCNWLW134 TaxID=3122064 RepID=UPI00300F8418